MSKSKKALVMLSGGIDSSTCLYWAKKKFSDVLAITFNYYGRLENEKKATVQLARRAAVTNLLQVNVPFIKEYSEFLDIKWIIGGHNSQDAGFFKDATKGYIKKINSLLKYGRPVIGRNTPT